MGVAKWEGSKNVGRIIIAWDGFEERKGQIITETKDRWGVWYMVAFEDGSIDDGVAKHSVTDQKNGIGYRYDATKDIQ